ncbi:MAG: DUF3833 domain-containing protein [Pseudomonadota bacterium]
MDILLAITAGVLIAILGMVLWTRRLTFVAQKPEDYADQGPAFDLRTHLSGPILCEGVIYGPTGRVASRFTADMEGDWQGNVGTLKEHFRYDTGREQDRCWTLALGNDGSIKADAPDIIGTGQGVQSGPSVQLNYKIKLPDEAGGHVLDVTDWMYLVENGTVINRSQFRKFGIKVAELVATMRRKSTA